MHLLQRLMWKYSIQRQHLYCTRAAISVLKQVEVKEEMKETNLNTDKSAQSQIALKAFECPGKWERSLANEKFTLCCHPKVGTAALWRVGVRVVLPQTRLDKRPHEATFNIMTKLWTRKPQLICTRVCVHLCVCVCAQFAWSYVHRSAASGVGLRAALNEQGWAHPLSNLAALVGAGRRRRRRRRRRGKIYSLFILLWPLCLGDSSSGKGDGYEPPCLWPASAPTQVWR